MTDEVKELSNYEKVYQHFCRIFLELDHEKVSKKLLLRMDDENLYIPYFHQECALNRKTAELTWTGDGSPADINDRLLIMHHLCFYKDDAELTGEMIPFRDIRGVAHFEQAHRNMTVLPMAKACAVHPERFIERARELGGRIEAFGDASATLLAFPTIPLTYIFWDGDEEFAASVNILFDRSITQFIHPESVPGIAGVGARLLSGMNDKLVENATNI